MVEQRSPKPRAEGSSPSAPAKMKDIAFAVPFFFVCSKRFVLSEARGACRGAKRVAAACGRRRQAAEVKKQGALQRAKSEQGDYVSEGQSP